MKVIFSLFLIFLYCKQSVANDLWTIDKNISTIEFEVPVLFAKNVTGKFNTFDGFVSLDLSNENNNKALINVSIDSLDLNYKRYKDLVLSEIFFDSKKFPFGLIDTNNFKKHNDIKLIFKNKQNIPFKIPKNNYKCGDRILVTKQNDNTTQRRIA